MPLERSTKRKSSDCAAAPPPCAAKCARGSGSSVQEGPSATANESSQAEQVCAGIDHSFCVCIGDTFRAAHCTPCISYDPL